MQLLDKTNYMKRMFQIGAVVLVALSILIIAFEHKYGDRLNEFFRGETVYQTEYVDVKEERMKEIRNSEEFQQKIDAEVEKMYLKEETEKNQERLLELQDAGFSGEQVSVLREFLNDYNPDLASYAEEIVTFPRWVEAVAIAGKETTFCTAGVGDSKNNCGAIKNSKTGNFKVYANELDAIEDISILLQKDAYKDKSIAQMNGLYCQDASNHNRQCDNWTEVIEHYIGKLQLAMLN